MRDCCKPTLYKRYKFPACSNSLVFLTDVISASLTLKFHHKNIGTFEVTKNTAADGKFTLLLSDLPKPYIFNPWFGPYGLSLKYEGQEYVAFLTDNAEYSVISLEAEKSLQPPLVYTFTSFKFDLVSDPLPPGEEVGLDYFALDIDFILE